MQIIPGITLYLHELLKCLACLLWILMNGTNLDSENSAPSAYVTWVFEKIFTIKE